MTVARAVSVQSSFARCAITCRSIHRGVVLTDINPPVVDFRESLPLIRQHRSIPLRNYGDGAKRVYLTLYFRLCTVRV